jgi:hypothetical protein
MKDWDSDSDEVFRAARRALSPTAADRNQVRTRLKKLGVGGAVVTTAALTAKTATGASWLPLLAKIGIPLALAIVGTAAVVSSVKRAEPNDNVSPTTRAAVPKESSVPSVPAAPSALPRAEELPPDPVAEPSATEVTAATTASVGGRALHPATTKAAQPAATGVVTEEEARVVTDLDTALRVGDMARATTLADEHARRFPNGMLRQEREGARVLIQCARSPNADAATTFLRAHPRSPMRARILAACEK